MVTKTNTKKTSAKKLVFVSYSRKDTAIVQPVLKKLKHDGILVWYDKEGIPPSAIWRKTIAENVDSCSAFIVFLSGKSVQSENVKDQLNAAIDRRGEIKLIPIFTEDFDETQLPTEFKMPLSRIQHLVMTNRSYYRQLLSLLED